MPHRVIGGSAADLQSDRWRSVAEYLTELPPRAVPQQRFHEAVAHARARLAQREGRESSSQDLCGAAI